MSNTELQSCQFEADRLLSIASDSAIKVVAFYLPQYHPIPENDKSWGTGFTEWNNVTRAAPEFPGHHQPRRPRDLGFYDLRLPEVQVQQARIASQAGVTAFCYYYYWFDGRKPLILPIDNHRNSADISLPFCMCFANENWTKRWDGLENDVILAQNFNDDFAEKFWNDAKEYLLDPKYLKDEIGRPYFFIYRPNQIPEFEAAAAKWRELAVQAGLPGLNIIGASAFESLESPTAGLDGMYEFPPLNSYGLTVFGRTPSIEPLPGKSENSVTRVHDYRQFVFHERLTKSSPPDLCPAVMPDWDNVARRPLRGDAFAHSSPKLFEEWVKGAASRALQSEQRMLFVNAWNEWGEGAYLEADQKYGWAYLNSLSRGIARAAKPESHPATRVAIFIHAFYPEIFLEYVELLRERVTFDFHLIVTTPDRRSIGAPALQYMRSFEVIEVSNKGRDIRPFLIALRETTTSFDIGLKLHTKKSLHRVDGDQWRKMLVDDLVPARGAKAIVELMGSDPNVGFIAPDDHWVPMSSYVGSNLAKLGEISTMLKLDLDEDKMAQARFIAGSMFWFRREAMSLYDNDSLLELFDEENGQIDGTAAHAFERLFAWIGETLGYITVERKRVDALLWQIREDKYSVTDRLRLFADRDVTAPGIRIALGKADSQSAPAPVAPVASVPTNDRPQASSGAVLRGMYRQWVPLRVRRALRKGLGLQYD